MNQQPRDIDEQYALMIAAYDDCTGRDRGGMLPEERRRFAALLVTGFCERAVRTQDDIERALYVACDRIEADADAVRLIEREQG